MNPIESVEHGPLKGQIFLDPEPANPRDDDTAAVLWCWHRQHNLGDPGDRPSTALFVQADVEAQITQRGERVAGLLPVFLLDHSGLAVRTKPFGDQWDSGQVGWAFLTEQAARDAGLDPDLEGFAEQAKALIESEVSTYNLYLMGEVYGYAIEGSDVQEQCMGFYGLEDARKGLANHLSELAPAMTPVPPPISRPRR